MQLNTTVEPRVLNQKKDKIDWSNSVFIGRPSKYGINFRLELVMKPLLFMSAISNKHPVNDLYELKGKILFVFVHQSHAMVMSG